MESPHPVCDGWIRDQSERRLNDVISRQKELIRLLEMDRDRWKRDCAAILVEYEKVKSSRDELREFLNRGCGNE